jgi:hypothetical protein
MEHSLEAVAPAESVTVMEKVWVPRVGLPVRRPVLEFTEPHEGPPEMAKVEYTPLPPVAVMADE